MECAALHIWFWFWCWAGRGNRFQKNTLSACDKHGARANVLRAVWPVWRTPKTKWKAAMTDQTSNKQNEKPITRFAFLEINIPQNPKNMLTKHYPHAAFSPAVFCCYSECIYLLLKEKKSKWVIQFSSRGKELVWTRLKRSLKELTVALRLAHSWVYLGRFNSLSTYPFSLAHAWKLESKITHQIVARSNRGVDVYSISSRCFLPPTGRDWFWSFPLNCVYKHCVFVHTYIQCMLVCVLRTREQIFKNIFIRKSFSLHLWKKSKWSQF